MPKISVIIPIFNGEKHISHCIRKLQEQTLADIEIICVDDGSVDLTASIIQELQAKDNRIKYLYQENSGAGVARNLGIENATGEYIGFVDSDDEYADETVLEILYNTAIEQNTLICGGSWQFDDIENSHDNKRVFSEDRWYDYNDYQFDFGFTRFIYRKSIFCNSKIRFPELRAFEDPVFMLRAFNEVQRFYAISKTVYHYTSSHHKDLSVENTIHYLKGLSINLSFSCEKKYEKLHRQNYERLISTASYFVEKNLDKTNEIRLYYALMDARGSVNIGLLQESGLEIDSQIKIPALDFIWNTSQRYLTSFTTKAKRKLKGTRR